MFEFLKNLFSNFDTIEVRRYTKCFTGGSAYYKKPQKNALEIRVHSMYDKEDLGFPKLIELAKFLGTENVNVNDYDVAGCETCDYWSEYGYNIQVWDITEHLPEVEALTEQFLKITISK